MVNTIDSLKSMAVVFYTVAAKYTNIYNIAQDIM